MYLISNHYYNEILRLLEYIPRQAEGIRHSNNLRKSAICRRYLLRLSKYTGEGAKQRDSAEKLAKT
jgi:hypothetical protein